jgi:hypothetical protein
MDNDDMGSNPNMRTLEDRRSGIDTRSESDKQLMGERRSGVNRRSDTKTIRVGLKPTNEQLALFARRLRRASSSERGRDFFGVARGEYDFAIYPDVLRTVEWIDRLISSAEEESEQPANTGKITPRLQVSGRDRAEGES